MRKFLFCLSLIFLFAVSSALGQTIEARAVFKEAYTLLQTKKYYPAIEKFKQVLKEPYPLNDYAYFFTAQAYRESKNFNEAIQVYKTVLDYYEDSILIPKVLLGIAQSRMDLQDYETATATLQILLSQHPNHSVADQALYYLGVCWEKRGKNLSAAKTYRNLNLKYKGSYFAEKGLERLDKLAKKTSLAGYEAPAASIYNLGTKYFNNRNYYKAKEYFSRLTKFYRRSSIYDEAFIMLGRIKLRQNKLESAKYYFKKAINLNKDSKAKAMLYLGLTFAYQDKLNAAIKTLNKIVTYYSNSPVADEALAYIGKYHSQLGNEQAAIQTYAQLVARYPQSPQFGRALWIIGNLHYQKGDYEKAFETFKLVDKLPASSLSDQLLFWQGKCAEKVDKNVEAVVAYKKTIDLFDHSYYGYRAREELAKYNISIPVSTANSSSEVAIEIQDKNPKTSKRLKKYNELIALGLGDEAAEEATFLIEEVPVTKKDEARIAKYHAFVIKGKYAKPIHFAENKIKTAMSSGSLDKIDSRIWRFSYPRGYWRYVEKYSQKNGLDPHLTYAVIREESRFKSRARSRSWARGLMQIIPSTAKILCRTLGFRYSTWTTYQPHANIQMGTYYLSTLIKRFNGSVPLALAGYNGGPARVERWVKEYGNNFDLDVFVENIPLRETRNYVKKVMKSYYGYKRTYPDEQKPQG